MRFCQFPSSLTLCATLCQKLKCKFLISTGKYPVFHQDFNCHKIAKMKILTSTHPNIFNHSITMVSNILPQILTKSFFFFFFFFFTSRSWKQTSRNILIDLLLQSPFCRFTQIFKYGSKSEMIQNLI